MKSLIETESREFLQREDEQLFNAAFPAPFFQITPLEDKTKSDNPFRPEGFITHLPTGKKLIYEVKSLFQDQGYYTLSTMVEILKNRLQCIPSPYYANLSVDVILNNNLIDSFVQKVEKAVQQLNPDSILPIVEVACDGLLWLEIYEKHNYKHLEILGSRFGFGYYGEPKIVLRIRDRVHGSLKKFNDPETKSYPRVAAIFSHFGGDSSDIIDACFGDRPVGYHRCGDNGLYRHNKNTRISAIVLIKTSKNGQRQIQEGYVVLNPFAKNELEEFWFDKPHYGTWKWNKDTKVIEKIK